MLAQSDGSHDRLRAARYFVRNHTYEDLNFLRIWSAKENVGWVKRALAMTLETITQHGPPAPPLDQVPAGETNTPSPELAHSRALKEVASALLHELEPLVGLLGVKIKKEIPNYEVSETKRQFEILRLYFHALSNLRLASEVTNVEDLDIGVVLQELLDETDNLGLDIQLLGTPRCIAHVDKGLIRIAAINGIRNAIESSVEARDSRPVGPILINWGETDADYWIAIIDDGVGLGRIEDPGRTLGRTSKAGHFGMGLSIVKQAMQALEGHLSVTSPEGKGATFELRWYK
ncbi:sensor histidine kinase [Massilia sp. GCM10020059]|uniref:histidine kinase n=1 Tax=Massilia agrisoli TaxID=2892444 RepID=A0ABS8IPF1_9BURK|nr:ATP-binding protein [Massilia agrisoli]MCC6070477.1 hypothetical protein [Massilia agrisoli]